MFYMPSMIPVVAAGLIWAGVMNTQTGWINLALEAIGLPGPDWLNSTFWIYPALVLIGLWATGNLMLTLMGIGAFKYFDMAYILKNGTGGPDGATLFYNPNLYKNAFEYNLMGYGSALAWVLFLVGLQPPLLLALERGDRRQLRRHGLGSDYLPAGHAGRLCACLSGAQQRRVVRGRVCG